MSGESSKLGSKFLLFTLINTWIYDERESGGAGREEGGKGGGEQERIKQSGH